MATVDVLFEEQARLSPLAIAVSDKREQLTYQELNRRADILAAYLFELGVKPEEAVAILMRRSAQMIIAMLAVLKAGATYLPIDENCPAARLELILEDAGVRQALTDESNRSRLSGTSATAIVTSIVEQLGENRVARAAATADPLRRAYIMYTSGSTGAPKGVEILHRGIVRLVKNTNYVEFGSTDVVGQVANPAFDAITFEAWGALLNGARLAILEPETVLSPSLFASALTTEGITIMFLTSSLFSVLAATVPQAFSKMQTLVVGGDAVNPDAARTVLQSAPPQRLVNGYGPTECTTFSVCHLIQSVGLEAKTIPIGRPIANSEAFILNEELEIVRPGEAGDLYLGGDGLARGYLNNPELTRERFIRHPFDATPGARLYRTGDRARYQEGGTIEFLGRRDHQVKFHGFRIELGEIESALRKHPDVIDAVAKVLHASAHDDRLAGYVATAHPERLTEASLRKFLEEGLPKYMVPSHITVLNELPRNTVGKIDRAQLPDPMTAPASPLRKVEVLTSGLEAQVMAIWKRVLSLSSVGLDDSFFDVGGTSLTLVLVAHELVPVFGKPVEITDLFRYPTIRTLARFLGGVGSGHQTAELRDAQQRAMRQRTALGLRPTAKGR